MCLWLRCELIPVEHTHSSQSLSSQVDLDLLLGSTTCHLCDRRWGSDPPLVLTFIRSVNSAPCHLAMVGLLRG